MNLFVYGTLLTQYHVEAVLGHEVKYHPGHVVLKDWKRLPISGYAIAPANGDGVVGKILLDLNDTDLKILDRYEGVEFGWYQREPVTVDGIQCEVYAAGHNLLVEYGFARDDSH